MTAIESPKDAHDRIVSNLTNFKGAMAEASKSSKEARKALVEATEKRIWLVSGHPNIIAWLDKECGISERWYRSLLRTEKMIGEIRTMQHCTTGDPCINTEEVECASANAQAELAKTKPSKRAKVWSEAKATAGNENVNASHVRKARAKVDHRKAPTPNTDADPEPVPEAITQPDQSENEPPKTCVEAVVDVGLQDQIEALVQEVNRQRDRAAAAEHAMEEAVLERDASEKAKAIGAKPEATGPLTDREFLDQALKVVLALVPRVPLMAQRKQDEYGNAVLSGFKSVAERVVGQIVNRKALA